MYRYKSRLGYGTQENIIEFIGEVECATLLQQLLITLHSINPKVKRKEDIWINGEILYKVKSNIGDFIISDHYIYGFIFILKDEDQSVIEQIDALLADSLEFERS